MDKAEEFPKCEKEEIIWQGEFEGKKIVMTAHHVIWLGPPKKECEHPSLFREGQIEYWECRQCHKTFKTLKEAIQAKPPASTEKAEDEKMVREFTDYIWNSCRHMSHNDLDDKLKELVALSRRGRARGTRA